MKLLVLQHVPFEGPAAIASWASLRGHSIEHICCANSPAYPGQDSYDALMIMGGPMGVNDPLEWIAAEITFIKQAIEQNKIVLGVCLGAQMIAAALGARVCRNPQREIGWHPVERTTSVADHPPIAGALPAGFTPLHWHGETFDIPPGAVHLYRSDACENQAFAYGNRIVGLQFHLEFDAATAQRVADACPQELADGGDYVQTLDVMLADPGRFTASHELMFGLLDALFAIE